MSTVNSANNSGNGYGFDSSAKLPGDVQGIGQDLISNATAHSPKMLPSPNPVSGGMVADDNLNRSASSSNGAKYGDEFESGITFVDISVQAIGRGLDKIERPIAEISPVVQRAVTHAAKDLAGAAHDITQQGWERWNSPDNRFRRGLQNKLSKALHLAVQKTNSLLSTEQAQDIIDSTIGALRSVSARTEDTRNQLEKVTEKFVDGLFGVIYVEDNKPTSPERKSTGSDKNILTTDELYSDTALSRLKGERKELRKQLKDLDESDYSEAKSYISRSQTDKLLDIYLQLQNQDSALREPQSSLSKRLELLYRQQEEVNEPALKTTTG
jgi:hypothetical protein